MSPDFMARGLGWFSMGLGAAELIGANRLAKTLGMEGNEWLLRLFGAREIAQGLACLTLMPPTAGVWARVAGDALDIGTLLAHRTDENPKRQNVGIALAAVAGVTLFDLFTGLWLTEGRDGPINRTIRRPLERLEQHNEQRLFKAERRGVSYASAIAAGQSVDSTDSHIC